MVLLLLLVLVLVVVLHDPQGTQKVIQIPVVDIKALAKVPNNQIHKVSFKVIVERWSNALSDQLLYR